MVSTPRPTLGNIRGSPPGSPPRDISPASPKSWEDSLLELDSDLQKICGASRSPMASPGIYMRHCGGSPPAVNLSHSYPATSLMLPGQDRSLSPQTILCRRSVSQESALRASAPSINRSGSPGLPGFRPEHPRSQSCTGDEEGAARPLIVRHEETSERLAEKLSRICGPGQLPDLASPKHGKPLRAKNIMALSCTAVRRDSLKSAFRHQISLTGLQVVDVAACVTSGHRLHVLQVTKKESRVVADIQLPSSLNIHHVMCHVDGDNLVIRERSKPLWSCECAGVGPRYVPIIQQDDVTHQLKVVLHIPDELRYEDLSVRTVDDHLIISRKRVSYPGASSLQFEVGLVLPDMGDSRDVDASLTHSNQLYIVVTFDSSRHIC
ncbi:hypothetical protein LSH36_69g01015 [Paralvinella palmiformis]|uniref:Uncharacterized protein n=1 Tax=Paralvinella palmiformis TaxID=53620 RepID=A0AAD9K359_9ANNE|nr:hypothetical protein LSH36_69g01015 [Paralvinella palmiformis]